jgi:hypothetical protein
LNNLHFKAKHWSEYIKKKIPKTYVVEPILKILND